MKTLRIVMINLLAVTLIAVGVLVYTNNLDGVGHPVKFYEALSNTNVTISDSGSLTAITDKAKDYLASAESMPSKIRFRYTTQIDLASCLNEQATGTRGDGTKYTYDQYAAFTIQVPTSTKSIPFTISLIDDEGNVTDQYKYDPTYKPNQYSGNNGLMMTVYHGTSTSGSFF